MPANDMIVRYKGQEFEVRLDPGDESRLSGKKFYLWRKKNKRGGRVYHYVAMKLWAGGKGKTIYLHHLILGLPGDKQLVVDHIDRDPLNNTRDNLRVVTRRENTLNSYKYDPT